MLGEHSIKDGSQPVFELAIIVVRNDEIPNTIHAPLPQVRAVEIKLSEVGLAETFNEIFLDSSSGGNENGYMLVLHKIKKHFTQARGYQIGCVA